MDVYQKINFLFFGSFGLISFLLLFTFINFMVYSNIYDSTLSVEVVFPAIVAIILLLATIAGNAIPDFFSDFQKKIKILSQLIISIIFLNLICSIINIFLCDVEDKNIFNKVNKNIFCFSPLIHAIILLGVGLIIVIYVKMK